MSAETIKALILAAVAAGLVAAGGGAGWAWQGARADARVTALERDHAAERERTATDTANKLKAVAERADKVTAAAAAREAEQTRKLQETQHALNTATTGRPCLGGGALRVLEQSPGLQLGPVFVPASLSAGGPAAPATDPQDASADGYATDTDVAAWIAGAAALYESCRSRIRDIREVTSRD